MLTFTLIVVCLLGWVLALGFRMRARHLEREVLPLLQDADRRAKKELELARELTEWVQAVGGECAFGLSGYPEYAEGLTVDGSKAAIEEALRLGWLAQADCTWQWESVDRLYRECKPAGRASNPEEQLRELTLWAEEEAAS